MKTMCDDHVKPEFTADTLGSWSSSQDNSD